MCTAAVYRTKNTYFGRTLDYEFSYGDEVTITPRNYPLKFHHIGAIEKNYAILGMAHVVGDYPLYYDAINEKGLGMAVFLPVLRILPALPARIPLLSHAASGLCLSEYDPAPCISYDACHSYQKYHKEYSK